uniref:OCIA domain containing 2 n=1 Tax=Oryzias sinensis TaxID=183150 RepID=A0A8C8DY05_9TELE
NQAAAAIFHRGQCFCRNGLCLSVRQVLISSSVCFPHSALPLSLGSMAVTGGLIYNGVWKSSKRFGPFPKLAVAGLLGFAVGKASYIRTCQSKFQELGLKDFGPGSDRELCECVFEWVCECVCEWVNGTVTVKRFGP